MSDQADASVGWSEFDSRQAKNLFIESNLLNLHFLFSDLVSFTANEKWHGGTFEDNNSVLRSLCLVWSISASREIHKLQAAYCGIVDTCGSIPT